MYVIIVLSLILSVPELNAFNKVTEEEAHYLQEFYGKYCNETDDTVLAKLKICEDKNPPEIKKMESECLKTIRSKLGKEGEPSLGELRDMECDDEISHQFEKCMNQTLTPDKIKVLEKQYPLDKIAKEIMYCDCDVYAIKHKKD